MLFRFTPDKVSNEVNPDSLFGSRLYSQAEFFTANDHKERASVPLSIQCNGMHASYKLWFGLHVLLAYYDDGNKLLKSYTFTFVITILMVPTRYKGDIVAMVMGDFCHNCSENHLLNRDSHI